MAVVTEIRSRNTRLAKLDDPQGEYAAIILAVAGLVRINQGHRISHILDPEECLHAVSQGALGVECRENDAKTRALLQGLNHEPTRLTTAGERAIMRTLEGGCSVPIGVHSALKNDTLTLRGLVASLDGKKVVEHEDQVVLEGDVEKKEQTAAELGVRIANKLIDLGADAILQELAH